MSNYEPELLSLIGKVLNGSKSEAKAWVRSLERQAKKKDSSLAKEIQKIRNSQTDSNDQAVTSFVRAGKSSKSIPDELLYEENLEVPHPIFTENLGTQINEIIREWKNFTRLKDHDLSPANSLLFKGPPGVGKTMTAKWLSSHFDLPLATLDLASAISSYLGKTGKKLKKVVNFALENECILFFDEFDTIANKRNDDKEVGELRRLVNVLLQNIDDWESNSILIAATNHPDILDHAIWRRFDKVLDFPLPDSEKLKEAFNQKTTNHTVPEFLIEIYISIKNDYSYSDIETDLNEMKKKSVIQDKELKNCVLDRISEAADKGIFDPEDKKKHASDLSEFGLSQRKIAKYLNMSRKTIRQIQNKRSEEVART